MPTTSRDHLSSNIFGNKSTKPKRNFLKENMMQLKVIQKQGDKPNQGIVGAKTFKTPATKNLKTTNFMMQSSSTPPTVINSLISSTKPVKETGCISTACQTVDASQLAKLYKEGNVKFPSLKTLIKKPDETTKPVNKKGKEEAPTSDPPAKPNKNTSVDFVKLNATIQIKDKIRQRKPDPTKAPPNYQKGVLPKYLQSMKSQSLPENLSDDSEEDDSSIPAGHVLLSEADRKEHLDALRKRYADLILQLNKLPVKSDSLKSRQRKMEIEKELEKMEEGIKLFSMDRLYIKVEPGE